MTHDSFNFNLPGYRAIAEIYRAAKTVVYRAESIGLAGGETVRSVTIKVLASADPTERELAEFRHHYSLPAARLFIDRDRLQRLVFSG
ncbi:hypothetical protein [Chamaesiphon sp. OTE_75_metabat_556]|uniref:hypothetical protein n=1 Tax=Chamaesiphon sp. OTE_75_metabat_556 TaxID=2964692 RepID=UPI00286B0673|nr:hypothetical protein [Chamaesiphon sp. OTE_75_metabat_556]